MMIVAEGVVGEEGLGKEREREERNEQDCEGMMRGRRGQLVTMGTRVRLTVES